MKLFAFTALLSVLLISSTVYLIMDQSKTELMNLPGNSGKSECLYLEKTRLQQFMLVYSVRAVNNCDKPKKFTIFYILDDGKTRSITTECIAKHSYESTGFDGEEFVIDGIEEDC